MICVNLNGEIFLFDREAGANHLLPDKLVAQEAGNGTIQSGGH